MAITPVQIVSFDSSAAGATIPVTLTGVTAGNAILVLCAAEAPSPPASSISSCADDVNGSYGAAVTGAVDAADNECVAAFYFPNSAGGTLNITVTLAGSEIFRGIVAIELFDADLSAAVAGVASQVQNAAGTDAVTTGTLTPSGQPALLVGLSMATGTVPGSAPAAGTAFDNYGTFWPMGTASNFSRLETKRLTSTAAVAATFTQAAAVAHAQMAIAVLEKSGASAPVIELAAAGAVAFSSAGGSSVAPAWPTVGDGSGDYYDVLIVGMKPGAANTGSITDPSSPWALLGSLTGAGGYASTLGADTGNTNLWVYGRISDGTASGTLSVTVNVNGVNGVAEAKIVRLKKNIAGTWGAAFASGSDTAAGAVSVAFGSDPGVQASDLVLVGMIIPTDVNTAGTRWSAQGLSQSGVTFGVPLEIEEFGSSTGNDIGGMVCYSRVVAGTSGGVPTFVATPGTTSTNYRGPAAFVRLRVTAAAGGADKIPSRSRTLPEGPGNEATFRRSFSHAVFIPPPVVSEPLLRLRYRPDYGPLLEEILPQRFVSFPSSVDTPQLLLWSGFPDDLIPVERVQRARSGPLSGAPLAGSASVASAAFAASAVGLVTFNASAGAATSAFAAGAVGGETHSGAGASAAAPFATSGSSAESFAALATAASSPFAASSSGTETFTGSAACSPSVFAAAGNGAQGAFFSGTGSAACSPFAVTAAGTSAAFTGFGSAASSAFAVNCSASETFAGTCTTVANPFAATALGVLGNATTGAGAAAMARFAAASAAAEAFSGAGLCDVLPAAVDGVSAETFLCAGSVALFAFAAAALGDTGAGGFFGSATCAASVFSPGGLGLEAFDGSVSCACSPFGANGAQAYPFVSPPPASRLAYARPGKPRISRA